MSQKLLADQQIFSRRFNKTAFYVSRETFWWIAKVWKKTRLSFWLRVLNFKAFMWAFSGKYLKLLFAGSDDFFRNYTFFLEKFLQITFGTRTENCRAFRETLRHARQSCTLHLQKIILKRVFRFWCFVLLNIRRFWTKKFQPFREKFQQGRENCMLRLQKNILRKFFWREKSVLSLSVLERETLYLSVNIFRQRCENYKLRVQMKL